MAAQAAEARSGANELPEASEVTAPGKQNVQFWLKLITVLTRMDNSVAE